MTRADEEEGAGSARGVEWNNAVRLRGRLTSEPESRELPSGTTLVTFRLSVPRQAGAQAGGSKQTVDWFDCAVWGGRVRTQALRWRVGDVVELEGALRRRYYSSGEARAQTRVEIEVLGGRVLVRASRAHAQQSPGALAF